MRKHETTAHVTQQLLADQRVPPTVNGRATKAFPLPTPPRVLCSFEPEFSEIINIISDIFSINVDHMSIMVYFLLFYCPTLRWTLVEDRKFEKYELITKCFIMVTWQWHGFLSCNLSWNTSGREKTGEEEWWKLWQQQYNQSNSPITHSLPLTHVQTNTHTRTQTDPIHFRSH